MFFLTIFDNFLAYFLIHILKSQTICEDGTESYGSLADSRVT